MTIEYWKKLWYSVSIALREKFPNMELFLVRIFLYSDWIQENTAQKKIRIRTLFTQCWKQLWRYSLKHHVTIHLNLKIPILLHGVHKTPENNKAFLKPENVKDQSSSRFVMEHPFRTYEMDVPLQWNVTAALTRSISSRYTMSFRRL